MDIYPRSMVVADSTFSPEALTLVTLIATVILSAVRAVLIWEVFTTGANVSRVHDDITKYTRWENNEEMETFAEHSQAVFVTKTGRTALRSIPNLRDAEPLLPMKCSYTTRWVTVLKV